MILPDHIDPGFPIPWVWYAPTLSGLPGIEEKWMIEQFTKAGIYPVCNITSYPPKLETATGAYHLTVEELTRQLTENNPIDRLGPLAKARVPLFAIHGDIDDLVPLEMNSGEMKRLYDLLGGPMELIVPPGLGKNSLKASY